MFKLKNRGQSIIEYSVLIVIVLAVLLTMSSYIKRGLAGEWKKTVDDLGDQYDPRASNTDILQTMSTTVQTSISTESADGGFWTSRKDITATKDSKSGQMTTGSY